MYRFVLLAFFLLFSGCCSLSSSSNEQGSVCERIRDNREAAREGWRNAQDGFSQDARPTLHEGMKAQEVKQQLGPPSRKEKAQDDRIRWSYPDRSLTVLMKAGKVVDWKRQEPRGA